LNGDLARQPGLTSPGLATQENTVAAAFARPVPQLSSLKKLGNASHKPPARKSIKDSHRACGSFVNHIAGNGKRVAQGRPGFTRVREAMQRILG